jgi:hypothetical protein
VNPQSSESTPFDSWIAGEAASFMGRFVETRAANVVRDLEAARRVFEAAARSIEAALVAPGAADPTMRAFAEQCTARAGLDVMQARTEERVAASERLGAALAALQADLDAARTELKAERERAEAERARAEAERERAETERIRAEAERDRADKVQAESARFTAEFERSIDELHQEHAAVLEQHAQAYSSLPLDQLLNVFATFRRASSYSEVLSALLDGLVRELSRVALFEVRGGRLEGVQQRGFEFERDISKVIVPLSADSLLGRAVGSGRIETFFADEHGEPDGGMPFGGTPSCVLAIPIVAHGTTVAVIYADDADKAEFAGGAPRARAKFAELLQQHALLELIRVTMEQKSLGELREYAATLVSELEFAHSADADTGRNPLERQRRLRSDLDSARRIYAQRTAREGPLAAAFLDERLAEVMRGRRETIFAGDLAAVLGAPAAAPQNVVMFR